MTKLLSIIVLPNSDKLFGTNYYIGYGTNNAHLPYRAQLHNIQFKRLIYKKKKIYSVEWKKHIVF